MRETLERAASGLVYSSESDEPFTYFALDDAGHRADEPIDARALASLVGAPASAGVTDHAVADFLARHIQTSDPFDARAQAIRPRYEHLAAVIEQQLRGARAIRIVVPGDVRVRCYIAGRDAHGDIAGFVTSAIET
ncbi:MAG: nuclease A inhibitor family protein [Gemmatimonadaceae bacterium]